jgi:competence transcription factor ComK
MACTFFHLQNAWLKRKNTKEFYLTDKKTFYVIFSAFYIAILKPEIMEFEATIQNTSYTFNFINNTSVLISGNNAEYILYKNKQWHCADIINEKLLKNLGNAIEEHLKLSPC